MQSRRGTTPCRGLASRLRGDAFDEGECGLGVVGMDEEGGAAGDVGLEQAHAFVGGVPALDDDVVELVAEELVDDVLVLALDFEEVGEGADGGEVAVECRLCFLALA